MIQNKKKKCCQQSCFLPRSGSKVISPVALYCLNGKKKLIKTENNNRKNMHGIIIKDQQTYICDQNKITNFSQRAEQWDTIREKEVVKKLVKVTMKKQRKHKFQISPQFHKKAYVTTSPFDHHDATALALKKSSTRFFSDTFLNLVEFYAKFC